LVKNGGDEIREGVRIISLQKRSAIGRLLFVLPSILSYTIKNKFDIYHAHDPELIPILFILHLLGRNVVYDMHENFPAALKTKKIPLPIKKIIGIFWPVIERFVLLRINVLFAETSYKKHYPYIDNYLDILNMPLVGSLQKIRPEKNDVFSIGYVGGVNEERYIIKILDSLLRLQKEGLRIRFDCIGPISYSATEKKIKEYSSCLTDVHYYGRLPPNDAWKIVAKCHVGIAVLMPLPNYIESYPTKLFEYLALGLPVIASDFELYSFIIRDNDVGLCVNPLIVEEFEKSLLLLKKNPDTLRRMQKNTANFFNGKYSWEAEFNKLVSFYKKIICHPEH
jgi:glycosyltransferase involved in cell wall biosynthesis